LTIREEAWCIISGFGPVCQTITFENVDVGSLFSHMRYILREYGPSSYMKVIGSRSRSQKPKRSKIPIRTM